MPTGPRPAPPAGTARVAISGTILAGHWVNILWLKLTDGGTPVVNDLASVIDSFAAAWNTDLCAQMTDATTTEQFKAVWTPSVGSEIVYTKATAFAGSIGSEVNDRSICAVIDWQIGDYYRGGHPRTYLAGLPNAYVVNGSTLNATYRSALATAANSFRNAVNALTHGDITEVELGTVRFASAHAWLTPPVFRPYQSVGVRNYIGSMRRRIGAS